MNENKEFNYFGYKINYEIYGRGEPLIILNGIMMSTKSWYEFLPDLTKNNQVILLDFLDQGESDCYKGNDIYDITYQTDILKKLVDHLKIKELNIASISYGGFVALDFASKYPELVKNLIIFNASSYTTPWNKEIYKMWNEVAKLKNESIYYKATIPTIYSSKFYEENIEWMKEREEILIPLFSSEKFSNRMIRLTNSIMELDLRKNIKNIKANTLLVASALDILTPLSMQEDLNKNINNSKLVMVPNIGHATMYEDRKLFLTLILGFIL